LRGNNKSKGRTEGEISVNGKEVISYNNSSSSSSSKKARRLFIVRDRVQGEEKKEGIDK
jgi:hypothetical protein